jgi:alpha-L-rhamnosidase
MKTSLKILPKGFVILCLLTGMFVNCYGNQRLIVSNLKCEYLENPLGMDRLQPRFSWYISGNQRGIIQSAYHILVSDNPEDLNKGTGKSWDSGKISSNQSTNLEYNGSPLQSDKTYYWSVRVWNQNGEQSAECNPAFFHTGLLNPSDWGAKWIAAADTTISSPLFRKEFKIEKQVKEAYIYITAGGYYELLLNGEKVGNHVLDPSITDYRKRVLYATYDVTKQLKNGQNVAGVILGNGAFHLKKTEGRYCWANGGTDLGAPRLLVQLNVTYKDGSRQKIVTDNSWKSSAGPITFNNLYGGEDYDARMEKEGWSSTGYNDAAWQNVSLVKSPGGLVASQLMPSIKVTDTFKPISKTNPKPGLYLFDLGQNFSGWWRITVKGTAGLTIRVKGSETLNDSVFPKSLQPEDRLSKKQPYQSKIWTDYTLNGKGTEVYEPRFFYTGFRYVEVTTNKPEEIKSLEVEGRVVRTALESNGNFISSDSLLNKIHRATEWSIKSNTSSYPTDCPQREKGGYTGDGQIVAEASMHDFQMAAFYTNWLNDMQDVQEANGRIPNTSPQLVGGGGGGVAWGSAYVLVPWWMYQYYNDTRVLKEHYPTMKLWLGYLHNLAKTDSNPEEPYIINNFGSYWYTLGEWCAPIKRDDPNHPMIHTYYYYMNSLLLSKIATILGEKEDAVKYAALADTIKNALNKKFFNPDTNLYGSDTPYQTYQLLVLASDIIPEGHRGKVLQTLTDDIVKTHQGHLNTGIIGVKYMWPILMHNGLGDIAYSMVTQTTFPGFGYWIKRGATTLRESWDGTNSQNHQMFGAVDEYFYKYLAGIWSPTDGETSQGYKHIHIQPYIPQGLKSAEASLNTITGTIESSWKQEAGQLWLKVIIPANSDATVALPVSNFKNLTVKEKDRKVWENSTFAAGDEGVTNGRIDSGLLTFTVGSGTYEFVLSGK